VKVKVEPHLSHWGLCSKKQCAFDHAFPLPAQLDLASFPGLHAQLLSLAGLLPTFRIASDKTWVWRPEISHAGSSPLLVAYSMWQSWGRAWKWR